MWSEKQPQLLQLPGAYLVSKCSQCSPWSPPCLQPQERYPGKECPSPRVDTSNFDGRKFPLSPLELYSFLVQSRENHHCPIFQPTSGSFLLPAFYYGWSISSDNNPLLKWSKEYFAVALTWGSQLCPVGPQNTSASSAPWLWKVQGTVSQSVTP